MQARSLNEVGKPPVLARPSKDASATIANGSATSAGSAPFLAGKRVLVVEDEAILAIQVEDDLEQAGCEVVGPACSVRKALQLIECEPLEVAVLDYRLGADTSSEIAVRLRDRRIPFLFMTGNTLTDLPHDLRDVPCLQKPVRYEALIAALETVCKGR